MKRLLIVSCYAAVLTVAAGVRETIKTVLFPFREAVIAAQAESSLLPYRFKLGEPFKAGEVIVTLDDSRYALEEKRAAGQFAFARATYEDRKQLREKNFTSDYVLRKADFDRRTAENDLAKARLNLSYCSIKAPFSGKIVEILTREYETVRPGQPLFRMIDDHQLLAIMNVPMTEKKLMTVGSSVSIRFHEQKLIAAGTVYEVTPQADHRTGTVRIRVLVDNAGGRFKAGMTGELIHDE